MDRKRQVLTNIPEEELKKSVAQFESVGATKIETQEQPDGLWTITVVFGEEGGSRDLP